MFTIRRGREPDTVSVIGLHALVATKLTRLGDKAKDIVDVTNLPAAARVAGRPVDPEAIERYLAGDSEGARLLAELFREMEEE